MSWTEERVSLLTKLWGEGHTAAEIAKQLGGVTRNAVIGKAHRLKLSNRVSPIQQNKKPANKNVERKTSKKSVSSPNPSLGNARVETSALSSREKKKITHNKKAGDLYSLMDLKPRMCRWPCGDPKHGDFGFCGDNAMPGLPYCEEHAKMAYQASTRNRIFNAEKEAKEIKKQLEKTEERKKMAS
ncbi:MAG: GcrA family cell cycle regulator [Alphaproteobacteria bacterium]